MIAGRFAKKGLAMFSAVLLTAAYVCYQGGILRLPRGWAGSTPNANAGRSLIAAPTTMPTNENHENWSKVPSNTGPLTVSPTQDSKPRIMMSGSKSGPILRPEDVRLPDPQPLNDGIVVLQKPRTLVVTRPATQPAN